MVIEPATQIIALLSLALLLPSHAAATSHYTIHPLRLMSGSGGRPPAAGISCESWRLGVETNNLRDWKNVPASCVDYVGNYMLGDRYRQDSAVVAQAAIDYVEGLGLKGDGKDVWIFDIDETSLSNTPYYVGIGFGASPFNATSFGEWKLTGLAPALPETLKLYKKLRSLGVKVMFLSGRAEAERKITHGNLKSAGFHKWEKLILMAANTKLSSVSYKSSERQKLEQQGYRIIGNIGDQWSDILGAPEGNRTFKLPDPVYYIS